MTGSLRDAGAQAVDLVPDLGPAWIVLALAPLLLAAVVLLTAGRWPTAPGHRSIRLLSVTAALASAGTGDVLAGICAAMRARGLPSFEAACAAVWLHGRAAEFAGAGLIADDVAASIPRALALLDG